MKQNSSEIRFLRKLDLSDAMQLETGDRVGSYEILALLGAGGMGEVYQARDTRLGRTVAIKILPPDKLYDEEHKRRFIQEARAPRSDS